nr:MAG TPA: hypothetical protein [Bacteriophage sp.]
MAAIAGGGVYGKAINISCLLHFIAPLIPVTDDQTSQWIYVMVFNALNEAEKRWVKKGNVGSNG